MRFESDIWCKTPNRGLIKLVLEEISPTANCDANMISVDEWLIEQTPTPLCELVTSLISLLKLHLSEV